jgi:hypothetical protein
MWKRDEEINTREVQFDRNGRLNGSYENASHSTVTTLKEMNMRPQRLEKTSEIRICPHTLKQRKLRRMN